MKKSLLFILFLNITVTVFSQTTYTVNSTDDLPDININDAVCVDAKGNCTLRAAIQNANKTSNKDTIKFNISGNTPFVITVTDVMQPIQQPVIIDGRTQLNYINSPIIEIDGSNLPEGKNGIQLIGNSTGSDIYGLSIGGFKRLEVSPFSFGYGVYSTTGNHIFQSNFIGIKPDGATINSNTGGGLYFNNTGGNQIGGSLPNQGNVISGNGVGGLTFQGTTANSSATNNNIQGNLIGTDVTGKLSKGNRFNVQFINAPNNILGGNSASARNIISGANAPDDNTVGTGVAISGSESYGNKIIGNYIGTDITGSQSISNVRGGVLILTGANNNAIGTENPGEGNLISGNGAYGIYIEGGVGTDPVSFNSFKGNYIGLDATGNAALPNYRGIMMLAGVNNNNIIGGTTTNSKNVISGNTSAGIAIFSGENNQILGNYIGTNASGTATIGNNTGIDLRSANNSVGGSANGSRNIVSGNYIGIEISGITSSGCSIKGNYIGLNAAGNSALANTTGISLIASVNNTVIGGPNLSDRNIISGNAIRGLWISGTSHTIQNNYIGINPAGNGIIKNGNEGIRFNGTSTGTQVSENTISGNGTVSTTALNVYFNAANNVHFFSNKVGTLPDGITGVVNIGNGMFFNSSSNNIIGGASEIEGNIIGNHNLNGVAMSGLSSNNTVIYNKIGVGLDGVSVIGNAIIGIAISGTNTGNTISQNTIANNDRGVVLQASGGTPSEVTISENSIYNNSVLGIDLVGTSANDVDDADAGVNNLQNTPEISAINYLGGGAIEITYAVPSAITNSTYPLLIDFFGAVSGQGKFFISSDSYTTPGSKTITLNLPSGYNANDYNNIVATATDANGNTSEFGINVNYTLSVAQVKNQSIKLYPNPVSERLFVQFPSSDTYNLKVVNVLGKTVLTENNATSSTSLDVSTISKGLYFLNIYSEIGETQTIKFIKN
ncbi:putative secreted protein (Por secretion system target) [Mariniflexile fucanivorans]|uniref:Putative secreted protein (Por secretion system target) n=1 Tax=Mariniflexile fucanivorans TaxID=264023 RepID=A0A4R1RQW3_9FLAO|nr:T9SS type A sorting domain-containing protein [Mariniflexile fucanivorans]TCL68716.1 putative secreted protein (Por secretion system target) [Mariniflexile fucanivorans]